MANNEFTPAKINGRTFSIPLYQRLFSWKKENVKKLLSDMKEHLEKTPNNPYYLGMLTCKDKELIDGQQRMTVMMLMGIVMKNYQADGNGWNEFLQDGKRIEFTARSDDQGYIEKMIKMVKKDEQIIDPEGYVNYNMKSALETIDRFMKDNFDDDNERKVFAENVYKHLTFFIAELPENYGRNDRKSEVLLNKYFEAMNSAGRNLEQHEILKVDLLKKTSGDKEILTKIWNFVSQMDKLLVIRKDNEKNEDFRKKYKELINMCLNPNKEQINKKVIEYCYSDKKGENSDKSKEETIGDISPKKVNFENNIKTAGSDAIISFEEFLLMVLDIKKNLFDAGNRGVLNHYKKENLRKNFEANLKDSDIESFYYDMLLYRLLLDYYVIRREFDGGEIERYSLNVRDEKGGDDDNRDDVKKLVQYQSMLYVSTEFYRWLKPYLKVVKENLEISVEDLLKNLKLIDNGIKRNDNDNIEEHVKDKIKEEKFVYKVVDRYWFWRLDYYLWEDRKNQDWYKQNKEAQQAVDYFIFRANRSVEHFYPQDQNQQERPWDNNIIDINSFGNLALISVSFNSQQNNDHMKLKMARIESHISQRKLQSLKLLRMYIDAGNDGWTEEKAKKHQAEMLQILRESYKEC